MPAEERYRERGVSAQKEEVHAAVAGADPGLYPGAFCKIVPDGLAGSDAHCLAMHADGAGTKSVIAYLAYKESGDPAVFEGIVQDAVVMNLDDLLCVGALGPFLYSNTIGRHAKRVPGEVLSALMRGFQQQEEQFSRWGISLVGTGGETADVGDVVGTLILDVTMITRMLRSEVIANDGARPGDLIIGLSSTGQAVNEAVHNSGIGSNGLTSARHDLLGRAYGERYPESAAADTPAHLRYCGPYNLDDPLPGTPLTVGQALLSPTRSHAPVIKALLDGHRKDVGALVHCTGGGQTKILRTGGAAQGLHFVKDSLFGVPPIFSTIQEVTATPWREMMQVFNMGHRMEVVGRPSLLPILEEIGREHGIGVRRVGYCEEAGGPGNRLTIATPGGRETYSL